MSSVSSVPTAAVDEVRRFLAAADPQRVTSGQAAALVELFTDLERLAVAGKILFAAKAAQSTAWIDAGHKSAASWMAERAQGGLGEAIAELEASRRLEDLDATSEALRAGRLSAAQVREVARAADKDPAAERALLDVAATGTLKRLKEHARQIMASATSREDEAERYRAIRDARYLRHFTDHDGAVRFEARLTPDAGARVLSSIQAEADVLFEAARQAGLHERADAYRADALVALVTSGAGGAVGSERDERRRARRTDTVILKVDAAALRRGWTEAGEVCEIAGVGPVPVATALELLPSAFVNVVVHHGVDVLNVCRVGRAITAHMEIALEERDRTCVVPGCDVSRGLERHHFREDFAVSGRTSLAELARVCRRHHDMITYDGYALDGGPGAWTFRGPGPLEAFADTG